MTQLEITWRSKLRECLLANSVRFRSGSEACHSRDCRLAGDGPRLKTEKKKKPFHLSRPRYNQLITGSAKLVRSGKTPRAFFFNNNKKIYTVKRADNDPDYSFLLFSWFIKNFSKFPIAFIHLPFAMGWLEWSAVHISPFLIFIRPLTLKFLSRGGGMGRVR